ncbi:MAG: LysR family transcriptional regulator [Clostridia bacterium]|nr:LysR family transcriptional regulator [Clostridia bacterium]
MFRHKDYILTIYEVGGFTKAAEKLFVSQPSLSATVKRVEDRIGAPIFDRSTSPIALTETGRKYIQYAMQMKSIEEDFERFVSDSDNLLTGKLRIGGSSFFSALILPELILEFNKKHPAIEFEILEDSTRNLIAKIGDNTLDLMIDNTVLNEEQIQAKVYQSERLVLAVPKCFAINEQLKDRRFTAEEIKADGHLKGKSLDLSKLKDLPFILLHAENDTGKRAEKLFKKYEMKPNVVFYLDQQITSYNMACMGIGVAFLSDTLVKRIAPSEDVYYYVVNDRIAQRDIYFYYKKNRYLSVACKRFIDYNTAEQV